MKKYIFLLLSFLALNLSGQTYTDSQFTSKDLAKVYRGTQTTVVSGVSTAIKQDSILARLSLIKSYAVNINSKFLDGSGNNVFLKSGTNLSYLKYIDQNIRDIGDGSVFVDQGDGNSYLRYLKRRGQNQYKNTDVESAASMAALKTAIDIYESAHPTLWLVSREIQEVSGTYYSFSDYSSN